MRQYIFNRQKPLGRYIVDFYCKPFKLVIEIDGAYHFEPDQRVKDMKRQQLLEQMGLRFLRFNEQEVRKDMDMVLKMISGFIDETGDVVERNTFGNAWAQKRRLENCRVGGNITTRRHIDDLDWAFRFAR